MYLRSTLWFVSSIGPSMSKLQHGKLLFADPIVEKMNIVSNYIPKAEVYLMGENR